MNRFHRENKIQRAAWLNMVIGCLLLAVFFINTFSLSANLQEERVERLEHTVLGFADSFLSELEHLRDTMVLCKDEAEFIMLSSGNFSNWEDIEPYTQRAIAKLSIMKRSIQSSARMVFGAPNIDGFISNTGMISSEHLVKSTWFSNLLAAGEEVPDLYSLETGWYPFRYFALYVEQGYNGSVFAAVVNLNLFSALENFNQSYPGQHIVVLDEEGQLFASTLNTARYALPDPAELLDLQTGDSYVLKGEDRPVCRVDSNDYTFLLFSDPSTPEKSYRSIGLSLGLMVFFTLLLLGLTMLNTQYFSRIHRSLGRRRSGVDEIQHIGIISRERLHYHQKEIERFLREAGCDRYPDEDVPRLVSTIGEEYEHYVVLYLAVQEAHGALSGNCFRQLEQFLSDHFGCHGVKIDEWRMAFVIDAEPGWECIDTVLSQFFISLPGDLRGWAGVSDRFGQPERILYAFEQARARMMNAPLRANRCFSLLSCEPDAHPRELPGDELIAALAEEMLSGEKSIGESLRSVFFGDVPMRLCDMQTLAARLEYVLRERTAQLKGQSIELLPEVHPEHIYHLEQLEFALHSLGQAVHEVLESENNTESMADVSPNVIVEWLQEHYMEDISLERVADQFGITPVHLSRWFKKENAINFSTYISTLRIRHARQLLDEDHTLKNAEIAERVGFVNVLTFTRQFKAQVGMTPDQYRRSIS